ncbi:hypothetical protein Unana1_06134 [Umbelopsis nana]
MEKDSFGYAANMKSGDEKEVNPPSLGAAHTADTMYIVKLLFGRCSGATVVTPRTAEFNSNPMLLAGG